MILKSKNKNFTDIKDLFKYKNIGIIKIVVFHKVSFRKKVFKYFIGYKDNNISLDHMYKFTFRCIFLPKMSAYRRDFHETKYMPFLIKDDELLEKHNEIWERIKDKNSVKKEFDWLHTVKNS